MKLLFGVLLLAAAALANTAPEQGSCLDEVMLVSIQTIRKYLICHHTAVSSAPNNSGKYQVATLGNHHFPTAATIPIEISF